MRQRWFTILLIFFGIVITGGQYVEHRNTVHRTESALEHRAQDLSAAFSVVIRSQGRGARMSRDRLESALVDLVKSAQLESVVLLDESGDVAASAGAPLDMAPDMLMNARIVKQKDRVMYANLVALGPGTPNWGPPPFDEPPDMPRGMGRRRNMTPPEDGPPPPPPGQRMRAFAQGPPRWMSHEEYDQLVQSQGIHWFLVSLSTLPAQKEILQDLLLRLSITAAIWVACIALIAAWRSQQKSAQLAVALVSAEESASRLSELNTTAAGLMHETRNPLNLIRGMAQMIEQEEGLPEETRTYALTITEEADRIAGRLKQFLDFARPPAPSLQAVAVLPVVEDLFTVLQMDREEKSIALEFFGPELCVEADEGMLRQMLFNLIHNALQAVEKGGSISVAVVDLPGKEAALEVRDTGPGIPKALQEEIFQPYVSHFDQGTGLGLSIVRQLARAQGWEVLCLPAVTGACFRIDGLKILGTAVGRECL